MSSLSLEKLIEMGALHLKEFLIKGIWSLCSLLDTIIFFLGAENKG